MFENPLYSPNNTPQIQNALTPVDHNNVVELYNPTGNSIDLASYSIVLTPENSGTPIIQYLYGTIESHKTALISNFNSNSDITSVAEVISSLIEFQGKVQIELVKNGNEIKDRIGQIGISNPVQIDINQYLNDPVYLNGQEIDLTSIANFGIRRNVQVTKGCENFQNSDLVTEWAIFPNSSLDNLGQHYNTCTQSIWLEVEPITKLCIEDDSDLMDIDVKWNNITQNFNFKVQNDGGSATLNVDYNGFTSSPQFGVHNITGSPMYPANNGWYSAFVGNVINDNIPEPNETVKYKLVCSGSTNGISGINSSVTFTILANDIGLNVANFEKNNIKVFPTVTKDFINISAPQENFKALYLSNMLGHTVLYTEKLENTLDISNLPSGYYILSFVGKDYYNTIKILKY
ncbi:MAG: T9SS type A sorting domain-containing protein [Flavobacteriales bacterium]